MKIAFLNLYQGAVSRGAETFVAELSKRLGVEHKVEVISGGARQLSRWPILWRAFLDPQGIAVALFTLKYIPKIWRQKYDVIIPLNGGWQPALIRIITWFYGGRMVISGQSGKGWDDRNNLWCFPDVFVALSSKLTDWAKKANPLLRWIEYIPNGVDTDVFRPDGEKMDFKLERPVVLTVGALDKDKRMDLVIRAMSKVPNGSLAVVGKGPLKAKLKKLANKLLRGRFLITSFDFDKMPQVYRGADVFTLASPWFRSFEIVIVEAMATNLAVVVNNDGIRRQIVGSAGILVNPQDAKSYAAALRSALNKDWGDVPRRQAQKFDWDEIAGKYEDLFESLKR